MTEIETLINVIGPAEYGIPGWVGRGIAFGESGHCWGKPYDDPCWIAIEPDGRKSVGPFQVHDIHGLSIEWRQNFENNIRWAMENSVGPSYRGAASQWPERVGQEVYRAFFLEYVWRFGQRCAEWAVAPAVQRAIAYLDGYDEEHKEVEPMPTETVPAPGLDKTISSCVKAITGILTSNWPKIEVEVPEVGKAVNLVLVTYFNQSAWLDYLVALNAVPKLIDDWLSPQGLKVNIWNVEHVSLPGNPGSYNMLSLVKAIEDRLGTGILDKDNALYIFSQDPEHELVLYGTLGGDWFGGPQFPSVSMFMITGVDALAYDRTHPNSEGTWTRNKALGAIAHELGHNLCGLRCADYPHVDRCVMKSWYNWPHVEYEVAGYTFESINPNPQKYDETQALRDSGFMK